MLQDMLIVIQVIYVQFFKLSTQANKEHHKLTKFHRFVQILHEIWFLEGSYKNCMNFVL
jgi:hypothetical protein